MPDAPLPSLSEGRVLTRPSTGYSYMGACNIESRCYHNILSADSRDATWMEHVTTTTTTTTTTTPHPRALDSCGTQLDSAHPVQMGNFFNLDGYFRLGGKGREQWSVFIRARLICQVDMDDAEASPGHACNRANQEILLMWNSSIPKNPRLVASVNLIISFI